MRSFQNNEFYLSEAKVAQGGNSLLPMNALPQGSRPIGSLSNNDGDVNENGKIKTKQKQTKTKIGQIRKTTTLDVHHTFLYISLPSLHDYICTTWAEVKLSNLWVTFCGGRELARQRLSFRTQLQKILPQHSTNWMTWTFPNSSSIRTDGIIVPCGKPF